MLINIPQILIEEALTCHFIQQQGSINTIDVRSTDVQRRTSHFAELVIGIIINEFRHKKLLPYNNK